MSIPDIASALRAQARALTIADIRFWGFAVVPAHDQAWTLVSTHVEGDRLELFLVHHSGAGRPICLTVTGPEGLRVGPRGLAIDRASRLHLQDREAWLDGDGFIIRTPRGEGRWPLPALPALTLGHPPEAP